MKPPTPQAISALLKRAGFEKSESSASRIKGWRNYTEGYSAIRYDSVTVEVIHNRGCAFGDEAETRRAEMLARYTEAITAAGWAVDRQEAHLLVTAREEPR